MKKHSIKPGVQRTITCLGLQDGQETDRLHSESGDQWFLLRMAACHKQETAGIDTGPHTVQHLPK